MIPDLTLADDGTLDTVFACADCGREIRFGDLAEYRDESGALGRDGLEYARETHADECAGLVPTLEARAVVEVLAEFDDVDPEGNASAIDEETDARILADIRRRLADGDVWAWASVEVRASFAGFSASDFLGGCSYESEEDFRTPGGYFDDMREIALRALAEEVKGARDVLAELFEEVEE